METVFSKHSSERILTRLSMTKSELANILDNDKTIDVALEPASNRVHRLFYSVKDHCCFLAVQDCKTGTLVTVVPVNNHGMGNNISLEAQASAQLIIEKPYSKHQQSELYSKNLSDTAIKNLKFIGYMFDSSGSIKIVNFGTELYNEGDFQIDELPNNKAFVKEFQQTFHEVVLKKKLNTSEIQTLYVRIGKKKEPILIDDTTAGKLLNSDYSAHVH